MIDDDTILSWEDGVTYYLLLLSTPSTADNLLPLEVDFLFCALNNNIGPILAPFGLAFCLAAEPVKLNFAASISGAGDRFWLLVCVDTTGSILAPT